MGAYGKISEMEQRIYFNTLQESLSINYALVSQKLFEQAQEQAFNELDFEECTEEQCFALIQELLQVENLVLFQIVREDTFSQLTLTHIDLDNQRTVRTAFCEDCGIGQINRQIDDLVRKIVEATPDVSLAGTPIPPTPKQEPPPKQVPEPVPEVKQEPVVEVAPEPETALETTASVEETPADSLAGPPIRLTPKQEPQSEQTPEPVKEAELQPVREVQPEPVTEAAPEATATVEETSDASLAGTPIPLTPKQEPQQLVKEAEPEPVKEAEPEPVKEAEPEPVKEAEPEPPPTVEVPDEAPSETVVASERDMTWHYVTLGIAGVALLQSLSNANQFNALASKNQELADSYASSSSAATKSKYQSNQSKMKSYKSQVQLWDTITLLALGVEAYLWFSESPDTMASRFSPRVLAFSSPQAPRGFNLKWQWQF